jgi:hypothetical protein
MSSRSWILLLAVCLLSVIPLGAQVRKRQKRAMTWS